MSDEREKLIAEIDEHFCGGASPHGPQTIVEHLLYRCRWALAPTPQPASVEYVEGMPVAWGEPIATQPASVEICESCKGPVYPPTYLCGCKFNAPPLPSQAASERTLPQDFRPGDPVTYVPYHAHGDLAHKDCEHGFVTSTNDHYVFVRFKLDYTSQACKPDQLR